MSIFNVTRRQQGGTKPKQLRRQGVLPMALIERSHETVPIQAPMDLARQALSHPDSHGRIEIQIDGEGPRHAVIKQIEQDVLQHQILTITLQEVADEDMLKVDVPVVAVGTPKALDEASGAVLSNPLDHLKIRGRVADLPDHIEVDVTNLEIGSHIAAGEVPLPAGIELLTPAEATLFVANYVKEPEAIIEEAETEPAGFTDPEAPSQANLPGE